MLALAADEIVMDENAVLGPVDPQVGSYPAASILQAARAKPVDKLEDETVILADIARKAMVQVEDTVSSLLRDKMPEEEASRIGGLLTEGNWTHDYPLTLKQLKSIGLPVTAGLPWEVYRLMELYPQPPQRRPSVQYVPVPYRKDRD
jgi:ClpP class serine protease